MMADIVARVHGNIGDRDICRRGKGSGCRFSRRSCMLRGAAEIAAKNASGPGSFKEKLIDAVYNLDSGTIKRMQKIVTAED